MINTQVMIQSPRSDKTLRQAQRGILQVYAKEVFVVVIIFLGKIITTIVRAKGRGIFEA